MLWGVPGVIVGLLQLSPLQQWTLQDLRSMPDELTELQATVGSHPWATVHIPTSCLNMELGTPGNACTVTLQIHIKTSLK